MDATVLATGQTNPLGIALGPDGVYWTDNANVGGAVMKVAFDGGNAVPVATGQNGPAGIAVSPMNVYWTTQDGGVSRSDLTGTNAAVIAGCGSPQAGGITLDSTSIYWTCPGNGLVMHAALDGSGAQPLAMNVMVVSSAPNHIAVDAQYAYVASMGILRIPLDGGAPQALGASEPLLGLASPVPAGGDLFYTDKSLIKVIRAAGGAAVASATVTPNMGTYFGVAADINTVYWTDMAGGGSGPGVYECPTSTCTTPQLVASSPQPFSIALAADAVYWTDKDSILKAAR